MVSKIRVLKFILIALSLLFPQSLSAADSLSKAMATSASGMKVQAKRIEIIAENVANADTTGLYPGDKPYRRKTVFFKQKRDRKTGAKLVSVEKIRRDKSDFKLVYQPAHPASDSDGYVKYPNVNKILETIDIKEAQRSYEANITAIQISRGMAERSLELMR